MNNVQDEFTKLYNKAIEIMKKLEEERTAYEKRILEVVKKYSFMPLFNDPKEKLKK